MTTDQGEAFAFLKFLEEEEKADTRSPSLDAILQNARRLLNDACLLYDNERFASATALAILAMEEKGKWLMTKWASEEGSVARDLNNHVTKQVRFASLTFVDVLIIEFVKQLHEMGFVIKHDTQMTEQQQQWVRLKDGLSLIREIMKGKKFMASLLQRVLEKEDGSLMARAQARELDKLKQKCMYVDVDTNLDVLADPADITQETASCLLRLARRFIGPGDSQEGNRTSEGPPGGPARPAAHGAA
jgi:AbiV family abortive infection protein